MADWVHCNACFCLPQNNVKFHLSSCGHIFCNACVSKGPDICHVCKQKCGYMEINKNLKQDIQLFFMDLGEIMKKQQKQLQQVFEFQKGHRNRFNQHLRAQGRDVVLKLRKKEEELNRARNALKRLQNEIQKLKSMKNPSLNGVLENSVLGPGFFNQPSSTPARVSDGAAFNFRPAMATPITNPYNEAWQGPSPAGGGLHLLGPSPSGSSGYGFNSMQTPQSIALRSSNLGSTGCNNNTVKHPVVNGTFPRYKK